MAKKQAKSAVASTTRRKSQNAKSPRKYETPELRRVPPERPCKFQLPGVGLCDLAEGHAGRHEIPVGAGADAHILATDGMGTYQEATR